MIGTYAAVLAVCGAALAIGQAALALCGVRRWSWIAPAVGLALLCAICWGTVRLPGEGAASAALALVATAAAAFFLRGRVEGGGEALRAGLPVGLLALAAASLPFLVEGRFGILGTGFNPDMSQHLLAADRLAEGAASQLLREGYPLGPHAAVVALDEALGIDPVQGFDGFTMAVAALAALTALTVFRELPPAWRTAAALLVGLPYLVASYYAQGAFKETTQALVVLAFALALREASVNPAWRGLPLRYVPAALIAAGSVYAYSFPGLTWLAAIAIAWALTEWLQGGRAAPAGGGGAGGPSARAESAEGNAPTLPQQGPGARSRPERQEAPPTRPTGPAGLSTITPDAGALRATALALIVFAIATLPELGRAIDFAGFETFDPAGAGLGNLFGQVSPFEALGIWLSGDFRLAPGDGAVPAVFFHLGVAFAAGLLIHGLIGAWRRRETAVVAGLIAVAAVYAAARVGGTPYTAAKAIEVAAPVAALTILLQLAWPLGRNICDQGVNGGGRSRGAPALLAAYIALAGGCSLLALANAPVGPASYTPALTGLRPLLAADSTLVLAPDRLLDEEHGTPYLAWELRGGRLCIEPGGAPSRRLPPGVRFVITFGAGAGRPPFPGLTLRRRAGPHLLWERRKVVGGPSPCPLIEVRQARQGPPP